MPQTLQLPANEAVATIDARHLYQYLNLHGNSPRGLALAGDYLQEQLHNVKSISCDLPEDFADLEHWMASNTSQAQERYADYVTARKHGAPRHYFTNRSHALYFLRAVAPTKLVDGAWLYGVARHWKNPLYHDLLRTYLEELGDGEESKNHVLLYRKLLAAHGAEQWQDLPNAFYMQGAIQLALAFQGEDLLPEVIGFNLGYEQLPLHLLITAYELNELGIDPYYFTLHVTVDNADSGHARRAIDAVRELLPQLGDQDAFWQRVRNGYKLNELGMGTTAVIRSFDLEREVVEIMTRKSIRGNGAHSDYCKVAGRTVNDWLSAPEQVPYFLDALKRAGWIVHDPDVGKSRFWDLLQGDRAQMFGVFNAFELQLIHDWLRGAASADGMPYTCSADRVGEAAQAQWRQPSYRAIQRQQLANTPSVPEAADADTLSLKQKVAALRDRDAVMDYLRDAISPLHHWKPAGLLATRMFAGLAAGTTAGTAALSRAAG
ncbi:MAG: iron-containing redox enzyme family protein [Comamonadaceae bacterium]|nr:MAG: iron-containing redox enzyme family protein [Comamonadaceae bacterium]